MTNEPITLARQEVEEHAEVRDALVEIREFAIQNDEDQEFAAEVLRDVKAKHTELEKRRKAITQPLNQALREVNALFRPLREALEEGERLLKGKIAEYQEAQAEKNARLLTEAAQAETWEEAEQTLGETQAANNPEGISIRHVWQPVVVDARQVPREFLSVDVGKLEAHAKAAPKGQEPSPVPGVRWEKKPIVTSRKKG